MIIKASSITNLTDARYFAAKEVQFLGFNLEVNTPSYIDPMYMKAFREWIEGPVIVGEFGETDLLLVEEAARFFDLGAIQLLRKDANGMEKFSDLQIFLEVPLEIKPEERRRFMAEMGKAASFFIVQSPSPEDPELADLCRDYPILLQTDGTPAEWMALYQKYQPTGFCMKGGEEERVGVKSFDDLEEIFETLVYPVNGQQ